MKNNKHKIIKIGIMGSGWVATNRHILAYKRLKGVTIEAIYNPILLEEAKNVATKFNIPRVFSNIDEFLNQPIDAVSICTPPMTHAELIKTSLEKGKHVLVEKPMTMTSKEGKELNELAQRKSLLLCPVHNFLFCRAMNKAKRIIQEGKIGEIVGTFGFQWSSWKRELPKWYLRLPGGLFFDESPHLIYLTSAILGEIEVENAWYTKQILDHEINLERFEIRLKGKKGWGVLSMWFGAPLSEWFFIICGTKGAILLDIFRDLAIFLPQEKKRTPFYLIEVMARVDFQAWTSMIKWFLTKQIHGRHLFGMEELVSKFVDSIRKGEDPPIKAEEGVKVVKIIEDILEKGGIINKNNIN